MDINENIKVFQILTTGIQKFRLLSTDFDAFTRMNGDSAKLNVHEINLTG
jgi:hypothetical protein